MDIEAESAEYKDGATVHCGTIVPRDSTSPKNFKAMASLLAMSAAASALNCSYRIIKFSLLGIDFSASHMKT